MPATCSSIGMEVVGLGSGEAGHLNGDERAGKFYHQTRRVASCKMEMLTMMALLVLTMMMMMMMRG